MAEQALLQGWRLRTLVASILAGAALYLAAVLWSGMGEVRDAVAAIGGAGLLLGLGLSLLNYGLRYLRWQYYLRRLGHRVPAGASLAIYLGGFTLTTTPAKAGEAVRALFLRDYGVGYQHTLGAMFAERLTDLLSVVVLALLGIWAYEPARGLVLPLGLAVVGIITGLQARDWLAAVRARLAARGPGRITAALGMLLDIVLTAGRCFTAPALTSGLLLALFAWAAEGVALYVFLSLADSPITLAEAQFIYAFALLVGAASLIPGGLGSTELAMTTLLTWKGVEPGTAVAVTVVLRLATLWFAVLVGAAALAVYRHRPQE